MVSPNSTQNIEFFFTIGSLRDHHNACVALSENELLSAPWFEWT